NRFNLGSRPLFSFGGASLFTLGGGRLLNFARNSERGLELPPQSFETKQAGGKFALQRANLVLRRGEARRDIPVLALQRRQLISQHDSVLRNLLRNYALLGDVLDALAVVKLAVDDEIIALHDLVGRHGFIDTLERNTKRRVVHLLRKRDE